MLESIVTNLCAILKDDNFQKYADDAFESLIEFVISGDPVSAVSTVKNTKDLILSIPAALFWDKMKRYLMGTFFDCQVRMQLAAKFERDSKEYLDYVKRMIHTINEVDDDRKIDYYANLTRCHLHYELDNSLFYKLCNFLVICTREELDYLRDFPIDGSATNSPMVSMLYRYGLFDQGRNDTSSEGGPAKYVLSDFAIALKQNCLNCEEPLNGAARLIGYSDLMPLNLTLRAYFG